MEKISKAENRATLKAISARLKATIVAHREGKPIIAEMAERIRQRAERAERERRESLERDARELA